MDSHYDSPRETFYSSEARALGVLKGPLHVSPVGDRLKEINNIHPVADQVSFDVTSPSLDPHFGPIFYAVVICDSIGISYDRRPCLRASWHLSTAYNSARLPVEYKYQVKNSGQCSQPVHPPPKILYDVTNVVIYRASGVQARSLSHLVATRWCARLPHPARRHEHWG